MKQEITGHTAFYCLLGSPVAHSISPQMYNLSFQRAGIDARYLAFDVKESELKTAVDGLRVMGVKGFNLTMPHKRTHPQAKPPAGHGGAVAGRAPGGGAPAPIRRGGDLRHTGDGHPGAPHHLD